MLISKSLTEIENKHIFLHIHIFERERERERNRFIKLYLIKS